MPALAAALAAHLAMAAALGLALELSPIEPLPQVAGLAPIALVTEPDPARDEAPRQFVSLAPPEREERPEDARFLDRYDRRVDREQVNPDDLLLATPAPERSPANPSPSAALASAASVAAREQSESVERRDAAIAQPPVVNDATDPREGAGRDADPTRPGSSGVPESAAAEQEPRRVDLSAFDATGAGRELLARRNDHLELAEGDRTMLNSLRSTYWSFFHRMQERVSGEWRPNTVLRRYDPTGELYGRRDRYTVLSVTLEGDGTLRYAVVARSSELDFLDDEAIRAFEAAAPFPNVPEGLRDEQGRATFRFGFFVDFGGGARVRRLP